ncbi:hypothetical protein EYY60_16855 [Flavobacterium zhairuonense]|uniref:hypothetical protein n=1 Tax=Flavobacterium zhairuonense TaxID=2493631 RepID=UPI00104AC2AC|nr:hypothetical protein [Flavobacterium zhairuonense]KAF2507625.1 hypothetical protein EYY60_16855 [Flavobacterium zhairuonense]
MKIIIYSTILCVLLPFVLLIIHRLSAKKDHKNKESIVHKQNLNVQSREYLKEYCKQLNNRKKIFIWFCIAITSIGPIWFFIYTVSETNALGKALIGEERYNSRMDDSYLYSFIILGLTLLILSPLVYIFKSFINQQISLITSFSDVDLLKVRFVNDRLSFIEKYFPPYIINENVIVITHIFLGKIIIDINKINAVNFKRMRVKGGYVYVFDIITSTQKKRISLSDDKILKENLLNEILNINPNVKMFEKEQGFFG